MLQANELLVTVALMVGAYLVCGIPFGLIVARRGADVDVRRVGSGNIGTTNVARSVGKGAAALTLLLDAGKGWASVTAARAIAVSTIAAGDAASCEPSGRLGLCVACVVLASILGHVFSPYLGFHGGKGIAVGLGATLAFEPVVALALLAVFVVVVAPTRIVSAASCSAAIALPIASVLLGGTTPAATVVLAITASVVLWAHRTNISKLMRGEEKRFSFHKKGEGSANGR